REAWRTPCRRGCIRLRDARKWLEVLTPSGKSGVFSGKTAHFFAPARVNEIACFDSHASDLDHLKLMPPSQHASTAPSQGAQNT
ncbi:unnamed protein product, partial [Mycena citricolor]